MERLFPQLINILDKEADLYQRLLITLGEENQFLVANDTQGLMTVSRRKDTLALQIRSLEESRQLVTEKLARLMNRSTSGLTLTDLCERAPEAFADPLRGLRDRLREGIEQSSVLNERNRSLLENAMRLLRGAMETMHRRARASAPVAQNYGPRPRMNQARLGAMVVSRQV